MDQLLIEIWTHLGLDKDSTQDSLWTNRQETISIEGFVPAETFQVWATNGCI